MAEQKIGDIVVGYKITLARYQAELKAAQSSTSTATRAMRVAAKSVSRAFKALAVVGVAALGAALVSTVKVTAEFEQAIANASSVSGSSRKELAKLARQLGKDTVFSAKQAAEAQYLLASAGLDVIDMAKVLPGVLNLAAGTQTDLASTTDTVLATLNQFNLEMDETDRVANVFAAAISNSQATMEKLSTSMRFAGPIAAQAGIEIEGVVGVLEGLFDAGFRGAQAGTILRGAFTRLLKPSKEASKVLAANNIELDELAVAMKDPVALFKIFEKANLTNAEAVTVFGQRALGLNSVIKKGSAALAENIRKITDTQKAAELAAKQLDTFAGDVKLLKSAWQEFQLTLGTEGIPILREWVQMIRGAVLSLSEMVTAVNKGSEAARNQLEWIMQGTTGNKVLREEIELLGEAYIKATDAHKQTIKTHGIYSVAAIKSRKSLQPLIDTIREWSKENELVFKSARDFGQAYIAMLDAVEDADLQAAAARAKHAEDERVRQEQAEADATAASEKKEEDLLFEEELALRRVEQQEAMYEQLGMAAEAFNAKLEKLRLKDEIATKKHLRTQFKTTSKEYKAEAKLAEDAAKVRMAAAKKAHNFRLEIAKILINTLVENAFTEKATLGSVAAAGIRAFGSYIAQKALLEAAAAAAKALAPGGAGYAPTAVAWAALAGTAKFASEAVASDIESKASGGKKAFGYGGIAYDQTNAIIGERGPELVLPPELTRDFLAGQRAGPVENNYGGNIITVNVDGGSPEEQGQQIAEQIDDYYESLGVRVAREPQY